jgi:predicted secreted protein
MKWTSMLAIYFIMWWIVLFAVLPFGVKNAAEAGEAVDGGNDAGAPVTHGLAWKAVVTTVVTTAVFAVFYVAMTTGIFETLDLPGFRDLPKI